MPIRDGKVRVLIAAKEREVRDHLRQLVLANEGYEVAGTAIDGQEAVQLAVLLRPDIALVKAELPIFNGREAAEMIGLAAPEVCSVLLGDGQPDTKVLEDAMKSGLRAYLPAPYKASELIQTMDSLARVESRRHTQEYHIATDPSRLPKVVVVTGGKGGIGKTTISTSVAVCLAKTNPGKVVLFDLYTQFGDAATMLDLSPTTSLSEIVAATDEIDLETLESAMVEHETGVRLLVSSLTPQPLDAISVAQAEAAIHALKRAYTYIVIDLPPILHATTLYVLANCYQLLLITNMFDMPTLRNAKNMLDKIVGTYVPEEKVAVIANRTSKYDRLNPVDVERMLGRAVAARVPNDPRLVSMVNQGLPFIKAYSKSPMAGAIESITREIIERKPVQKR